MFEVLGKMSVVDRGAVKSPKRQNKQKACFSPVHVCIISLVHKVAINVTRFFPEIILREKLMHLDIIETSRGLLTFETNSQKVP